jgi:hypothetical protein
MRRKKAGFVVVTVLAMMQASTGQTVPSRGAKGTPGTVSTGMWGGSDLQMAVTPQGASLEFDCAEGAVLEPLLLDANGKFQAGGTFHTLHGGPIRKNEPSNATDVLYSGVVEGDTMQLEFTLTAGAPEKFILVRGVPGKLRRCR